LGFTPPCGVTIVTGQCGCDNVTNMSGPSSATPQGSQSDSLGFVAKVLDAWTDEVSPYQRRHWLLVTVLTDKHPDTHRQTLLKTAVRVMEKKMTARECVRRQIGSTRA